MLLFNQVAVFFDHQYIWNKSIEQSVLDFLHRDSQVKKITCGSTTVGWLWPSAPNYIQAHWTPSCSHKGPIKYGLSILPSFFPSFHLSRCFLGIVSLFFFSKFWHGARIPCEVVHDRAGFSGKFFFTPKTGKMGPKWAKNRVFSIYWKIWSWIMKMYIICCVHAQNFVLEIWAKMS